MGHNDMIIYNHSGGKLGSHSLDDFVINWQPLFLATNWYFFKYENGSYDLSKIDLDVCRKRANQMKIGGKHEAHGPVVLDIEAFRFVVGDWEYGQDQLKGAIEIYREVLPHMRFGFYGIMPRRDYWAAVIPVKEPWNPKAHQQNRNWKKHNTLFKSERRDSLSSRGYAGLCDLVDFVSPSLYTFYEDVEGDLIYLRETIKQARRYNKPIIPWMWTQYHDSHATLKYTYIGDNYINQQLDLVESMNVEGVVWLNFKSNAPESFMQILKERYKKWEL